MHERLQAVEKLNAKDLERLQNSKVAVIGLGATGSTVAESLARYGVNLKIFDRDYLEKNDMYSSTIYNKEQCRKSIPKAEAAAQHLSDFTVIEKHIESLNSGNIKALDDVDLIIDATDNMQTRFLISEYSQKNDKPWIYTAALADQGCSMFFENKCFNCVFDQVNPGKLGTCRTEGIIRDIAALTAHKTSLKTFKYLTGQEVEETLNLVPQGEEFQVEASGCEVCQEQKYSHLNSLDKVSSICGENKYQINIESSEKAFQKLREQGKVIDDNEYILRVEIDNEEFALYRSGGALVEAEDEGHAEARFSEIIGI